jgi:hypothetical protein
VLPELKKKKGLLKPEITPSKGKETVLKVIFL